MSSILSSIIGPGIIAAIVAFFLNRNDDRRKFERDQSNEFIDSARNDIREVVALASEYFSIADQSKRVTIEAKILMYESDLRITLSGIRSDFSSSIKDIYHFGRAEQDFFSALTGGQFGTVFDGADFGQVRLVIGSGAVLRRRLREVRLAQSAQNNAPPRIMLFAILIVIVLWSFSAGFNIGLNEGIHLIAD